MAERILGPQGSKRRRRFLWVPILLVACFALFTVAGAQAVHDTGAFELDGNAVNGAAAGDDWDNVCHQKLGSDCGTSSNTTGATAVDWVAEANPNSSIFTGGGSKDPQDISNWAWKDAGGLPDKDNLLHGFAARYTTNEGEVLYFGSDRLDNSGDAQQGFWFFQNSIGLGSTPSGGGFNFTGVHRAGDLLIISDFSNGGTTSTISVYSWDPTCTKTGGTCGDANLRTLASSTTANCATAGANDAFCGLVNSSTITMPWSFTDKSGTANNGALNGEFYEGGVNLTRLGLGDRCFASVASETRSSTSTTATLKDFVLGGFGNCGSTTTTQSSITGSTSIGTGSVSVSDSATVAVTGVNTWAGTVQFHLHGPIGQANEASTDIGSPVAVSNTTPTVSSVSASVTAAGDYCWSAHFHATTTGVPDSDDDGTNECFTVTPVTPALTTTAGDDVLLGSPVTDTAGLSGTANQPGTPAINPTTAGAAAGGTIQFTLLKADCTTLATGTGTNPQSVTVSGNGTYGPVSFTPDAVGTYHWKAVYTPATGDPNNIGSTHNGDCSDSNETVVVSQLPTTTVTTPSDGSGTTLVGPVALGTQLFDRAVVTGSGAGGNPPGTVNFFICNPSETTLDNSNQPVCASGGTAVGSPTLTADVGSNPPTSHALSNGTAANVAGTWCFRATYVPSGTAYTGSGDATHGECIDVAKAPTTTTTSPSTTTTTIGGATVTDHATVVGSSADGPPTGSIAFFICDPTQTGLDVSNNPVCESGGTPLNTVTASTVSGASPPSTEGTSSAVTPNQVGVWCFRAEYTPGGANGGNYLASADGKNNECFTVTDSASGTSVQKWLPNDRATITSAGGTNLNGSVVMTLRSGSCTGPIVYTEPTFTSPAGGWPSPKSFDTTNSSTVVNVANNATPYFWRTVFTSSDPFVSGTIKCEQTSITITD